MKDTRNIDHLYRTKFKDVETLPPDAVWENISSRLPKKEQPIYPLWTKIAGVAAILALLLNLTYHVYQSSPTQTPVAGVNIRTELDREIRLASTDFTTTMLQTSMLLQSIMQLSEERTPLQNNGGSVRPHFDKMSLATAFQDYDLSNYYNTSDAIAAFSRIGSTPRQQEQVSPRNDGKDLMLAVQEEKEIRNAPEAASENGRLSFSTKVAPVYFDHFGSKNNLAPEFANGGGEVSLSYGVNLAYQVSDKVKLRSGINKVDLSYNTRGAGMASAMATVSSDARVLPFMMSTSGEGKMNRSMGFIEVPLEVEYQLIDNRLGLNLIGGASSLFLDSNSLSFDTHNSRTYLGEANNLNDLSFSANLGLGLNYELLPELELNLEPIFKYQLNTFNNTPGLNPYYFGVYTGFSFSF